MALPLQAEGSFGVSHCNGWDFEGPGLGTPWFLCSDLEVDLGVLRLGRREGAVDTGEL